MLTDHIIDSTSKLYPVDEWVTAEIEVHGNDEVIHRINGVEVLRYQHPQLDPREESAQKLLAAGAPLQLSFGHIALQAESQPIWFRNIRIRQLDPERPDAGDPPGRNSFVIQGVSRFQGIRAAAPSDG